MESIESSLQSALDELRRSLNDTQREQLKGVLALGNALAQQALREQLQATSQVYKLLDTFTDS